MSALKRPPTFFEALPPGHSFEELLDPERFTAVPSDWWVFVADVIDSTAAIRAGRYREVNFLGAAAIGAALNACGPAPKTCTFSQ